MNVYLRSSQEITELDASWQLRAIKDLKATEYALAQHLGVPVGVVGCYQVHIDAMLSGVAKTKAKKLENELRIAQAEANRLKKRAQELQRQNEQIRYQKTVDQRVQETEATKQRLLESTFPSLAEREFNGLYF